MFGILIFFFNFQKYNYNSTTTSNKLNKICQMSKDINNNVWSR